MSSLFLSDSLDYEKDKDKEKEVTKTDKIPEEAIVYKFIP